ncbi:MAG: hypothetical protein ACRCXC_11950 [Legionella sp.]
MKKKRSVLGLSLVLLSSSFAWAGSFNVHRGDLLDTDKVDIEWRKQSGNCQTKFPIESADCSYVYSNIKGLRATYIDQYSQHANFSTENTFLLNISINGVPVESCQMMQ